MRDLFNYPEPQPRHDVGAPMIVDSFAGGGGASTGIELALGRSPDIAINHNPAALALHAANHPETIHLSENVYKVDPLDHLAGRHIGLMWFSPDCKHFSKAKGGKPVARNIRDLAWIIPGWIERIQKSGGKVDVVMMENVEEFAGWGPLVETEKGLMPCPERKGQTFLKWCKALRKLGGKIERRELRACDYGAPTIRKRLFVIIRFDGRPIVWPAPTHGDPASEAVKSGKLKPWRTAAECIDWSLPCPSIFESAAEIWEKHGLRAKRPLATNTLARVARGMKRYVLEADEPFLVNLTHGGRTESAADPFRTITGAHRGEKAVIAPALATYYGHGDGRGTRTGTLTEPLRTVTTENRHALISPYLASIAHGDSGGRREYPLADPLGTVTVGGIQHAVIAPLMATMRNSQKPWQGVSDPNHTVTAGGAGLTLIAPSLMSLKGTARRDSAVTALHPTVLAGGGHSALIAPVLTYAQQGGRCRDISEPHHTICASRKDQNAVIIPTMIQTGYGERPGQAPRVLDLGKPLGTAVAGGIKHAACAAYIAQQNGGPRMEAHTGHHPQEPLSTITASGSNQTPVAAFFAKYYGTGDGAYMNEPLHTVTVQDRFGHVQAELAAPSFGPEHHDRARAVTEFLREHGAWTGGEYVTLEHGGETFVVIDIGMRMLTPRELFNAQGFPPDYVIEGVWEQTGGDWTWREFTKDVQVSCCGNSVCPPVAEALAGANCGHLVAVREEVAA
ncbi:DNA cytosine methyltransferase [Salipiger thiooxidans]|uniref:DNA cytosine methyltransferase n=1 Tax=Salipiger thiooxidans TaxID=282683 RepID=UPI001CF9933C|nr:DNA cytosine methyltransferase [Salipiger thiooxidans]